MADRLAALGGHFNITTGPGAGTTVAGTIPIATTTCTAHPIPTATTATLSPAS